MIKTLILATLLATQISSAQHPFCNKPESALCGEHLAGTNTDVTELKALERKVAKEAFDAATNKYRELGSVGNVTINEGFWKNIPQDSQETGTLVWKEFAQTLESNLKRELTQKYSYNYDQTLQDSFELVRNLLYSAIDQEAHLNDLRSVLKERVRSIELVLPHEAFARGDDRVVQNMKLRMYRGVCGDSGLQDNGAANSFSTTSSQHNLIVICPGRLIFGYKVSPIERFQNLLMLMAHEIGHIIDVAHFKDVYTSYVNCLERNSNPKAAQLKIDTDNKAGILREITSDYWAVRATEIYLKRWERQWMLPGRPETRQSVFDVVRRGWSFMCLQGSNEYYPPFPSHPDASARVDFLLGGGLEIQSFTRCEPKPEETLRPRLCDLTIENSRPKSRRGGSHIDKPLPNEYPKTPPHPKRRSRLKELLN